MGCFLLSSLLFRPLVPLFPRGGEFVFRITELLSRDILVKYRDRPIKASSEDKNRVSLEIIHDQLPLAVPCYDLVPVTNLTLGPAKAGTSGTLGFLDLTGSEYKT